MKAGLIGLGLLGSAIAERIESAGWELAGFDIDPAKTKVPTAAHAARAGKILLLSLPDSDAVASVLDDVELLLVAGQTVVDTTTGDPDAAVALGHRLAARQVGFIDAAVAGSSDQVRRGEVNVLAGGSPDALAAAMPIFDLFAQKVFHVGPCGSGARMKLISNLVLGLNRAALAEGLSFAEHLGIDPALTLEILKAGSTYSRVMDNKGPKMLARQYSPEARISQHLKDVLLMLKSGANLPLTSVHATLLARAEELGYGGSDNSAIVEVFRRE